MTALLFFAFLLTTAAQDIHFSQFYHSPQNLNPALIGIFKGDYRVASNFRSQWASVPVPYQTFTLSGDGKIRDKIFNKKGILSAGLLFNYDQAGDIAVKLSEIGLGISLQYPIENTTTISAGLSLTYNNRNIDPSKITTAAQFNGDEFNSNLANQENIDNPSINFLRTALGFNLHLRPNKKSRTRLDLGAAFGNVNKSKSSFKNNKDIPTAWRLNIHADSWLQLNSFIDIKGQGLFSLQGNFEKRVYQEFILGSGIRYHLNTKQDHEKSIALLASYRFGDAFIPAIEVGWRFLTAGFSYDFNTSPFQVATARRGGPEFSLVYIFTKPTPPPVFKACPIF